MLPFSLDFSFDQKAPAAAPRADVSGLSWEEFSRLFTLPTFSGQLVTPESAIRAIPVQACCALISGGLLSMPLRVIRRSISDGVWIQEPADGHPYWWLFNESPTDDCSAAEFWQQIATHILLYGEAFARIIRGNSGRSNNVVGLVFHKNPEVNVIKDWDPSERRNRVTLYSVSADGRTFGVDPSDMLHFIGKRGVADARVSASFESARQAIGIVLAIEEYCARIFTSGGTPRVALQYPSGAKITDEMKEAIRTNWPKQFGGGENSHLPLVIGGGGTIAKLSFSAEEAQMLEARKFQVIDIARAFGVPPFMIGETEKTSAWGSGIEQMSQAFIRYALSSHMTAIEQEVTRKLFRNSTYRVDFDEEALARGDMKSLGEWFRQAIGGSQGPGYLTPNEVRRRMNLPPVDGGDDLYDPKGVSNESDQATPGAGPASDPPEPGDDEPAEAA